MSVEAAAHDRAKSLLTIKRNERSPSREIAAHNQRNVQQSQLLQSAAGCQSALKVPLDPMIDGPGGGPSSDMQRLED
jgi:hypothetical protein